MISTILCTHFTEKSCKIQSVKFIINYYLSNYCNTVFLLYIYFVYIFNKYVSITQFLHFHQKLWHWLFGTNTNVGGNKRRTVQTSDAQTSDQYKRRTGTIIRKNVGLGRFWMDHCFKKFQTMNSTRSFSLIPISLQPDVRCFQEHFVDLLLYFQSFL